MAVTTEIDVTKNLIIHHFNDTVSLQIITKTIQNTLAYPGYEIGMNAIWVCDEGTKVNMSSEDTQKIGEYARKIFDTKGMNYKLALVGSDDLAYGMLRVYEGWSNDRPVNINVFRQLKDALSWIEEE